jgi:hypothetical protein
MEAQAAEMLAEEERNEGAMSEEGQQGDLGESDDDPPAPWIEDQKEKRKMDQTHREEAKIEAVMNGTPQRHRHAKKAKPQPPPAAAAVEEDEDPEHGDLGESDDVGVEAKASDANTLTSRAQASALAQTKVHEKATAIARAKQIANKVRKMVHQQKKLEQLSGQQVPGSILGEAQDQQNKEAQMAAHDSLMAQKMEDEQAQQSMQHLIDTERRHQQQMFQTERQTTHTLLQSVKHKLQTEQTKMLGAMKKETAAAVSNVENKLSETSLAKSVEDVVKKKLSKRLSELKAVGKQTIHGVEAQVEALRHRVRRLRREQGRMKLDEARASRESHSSRDLGESAGMGNSAMAMEMEKMRMEQQNMMMMRQQQQMMMQQPPQVNAEEHAEFLQMKQQMAEMKKQNALLQQMVTQQTSKVEQPRYTHDGLRKYFQNRHFNAAQLKKDVLAEQHRLRQNREAERTAFEDTALESESLVQLSEGAHDMATATAMPIYNQRVEQARVESENLIQSAHADALAAERRS